VNSFDTHLTGRLHDLANSEPGSTPPTSELLNRGRQARHRRIAARTSVSFAVLAIGAAIAITTAPTRSNPSATSDMAAEARVELVAALSKTQETSFKVEVTNTVEFSEINHHTYLTEGAFDPANVSGYLRSSQSDVEHRLVHGDLYMINGKNWVQATGKFKWLDFDLLGTVLDGALSSSADSEHLFDVLRKADATVTKTGSGLYHFDGMFTPNPDLGPFRLTGDVTLDSDSRIAKIAYDWRLTVRPTPMSGITGPRVFPKAEVIMEFSGYGTPVIVESPGVKPQG
jgi:hypothetical protein